VPEAEVDAEEGEGGVECDGDGGEDVEGCEMHRRGRDQQDVNTSKHGSDSS